MKTLKVALVSLLFVAITGSSRAQHWKDLGADSLFSMARTEVFRGDKPGGREKLKFILEKNPGYHEVRIFLARTYAWDRSYPDARRELLATLKDDPDNIDALYALADVELWSGNFAGALAVVQPAMTRYPDDDQLLYKEANALTMLGRNKEALLSLKRLLQARPGHAGGTALYDSIDTQRRRYTAGVLSGAEFFDRIFDPAYYLTVQLSRRSAWGSAHVRWNYAKRFSSDGSQFEVDLYPRITKGIYAYVNYGHSTSDLFPSGRIGTELYFKLPKGFETSAGIRYMDFAGDTRIVIYTGTVGWYSKNYWFSVRPFITPDATGTSVAATVSARRYFADAGSYIEVNGGVGFSPDLRRLQNAAGLSEDAIHLLKSQRIGLAWQQKIHKTWTFNLYADLSRQGVAYGKGEYVIISSSFVSVRKTF